MEMTKCKLLLAAGALTLVVLQACQDNMALNDIESLKDSSTEIRFTNFVGGMTRASRGTGSSFVAGDEITVYGFQNMDASESILLFNNQKVTCGADNQWTYAPAKYWDRTSTYEFYAAFPYSANPIFNKDTRLFNIAGFTVQDTARDQVDVMIAHRIKGHKPHNIVNLIFSHALSNVSFTVKASSGFNTDGITKIVVTGFDVTGLYSKGSFAQTGWSDDVFTGSWDPDVTSVYDLPEVKNQEYVIGSTTPLVLAQDLLLLPQTFAADASINITFKLVYSDNTECAFSRNIVMNKIMGAKTGSTPAAITRWDPNSKYNYDIAINPSLTEHGGHYYPIANDDHSQPELTDQDPDNPIKPVINIVPVDTDNDGVIDDYKIDSNLDDEPDYDIIWVDIDDDGYLEGLPDRDGDGQPDDSDGDGKPDIIWYDSDGDGIVDKELEKDPVTGKLTDELPQISNLIEFSAQVEDWDNIYNATYNF